MKPWMWSGIWWLVLFGGGFWLGILYKGRKIRPILAVLRSLFFRMLTKVKKIKGSKEVI